MSHRRPRRSLSSTFIHLSSRLILWKSIFWNAVPRIPFSLAPLQLRRFEGHSLILTKTDLLHCRDASILTATWTSRQLSVLLKDRDMISALVARGGAILGRGHRCRCQEVDLVVFGLPRKPKLFGRDSGFFGAQRKMQQSRRAALYQTLKCSNSKVLTPH